MFIRDLPNRGMVYIRALFVAPSERHETYTILKSWNRTTEYTELALVPGPVAEIQAMECRVKIALRVYYSPRG